MEDAEDVRLFYYVSFEFMRYLADTYGEERPWDVLRIVGAGENFDFATKMVFGNDYSQLFQDFKQAFFISNN